MTSTAEAPPATPAAKKKAPATRPYIVLEELELVNGADNDTLYRLVGTFVTGSAAAAQQEALDAALAKATLEDDADEDEATVAYIAIPVGNFNRKAPTVETKTVVKWS